MIEIPERILSQILKLVDVGHTLEDLRSLPGQLFWRAVYRQAELLGAEVRQVGDETILMFRGRPFKVIDPNYREDVKTLALVTTLRQDSLEKAMQDINGRGSRSGRMRGIDFLHTEVAKSTKSVSHLFSKLDQSLFESAKNVLLPTYDQFLNEGLRDARGETVKEWWMYVGFSADGDKLSEDIITVWSGHTEYQKKSASVLHDTAVAKKALESAYRKVTDAKDKELYGYGALTALGFEVIRSDGQLNDLLIELGQPVAKEKGANL